MKITILCTDDAHPVNAYLNKWICELDPQYEATVVRNRSDLTSGDFLFLVSCSEVVGAQYRANFRHTLVLHASDLPYGRGWSPHVWELIQGADFITLSLLEAEDKVDTGRIWLKERISVPKTALWDDVNHLLFEAEIKLINRALDEYKLIEPYEQCSDVSASYYPKRGPENSWINENSSISDQFDLLRMCDPARYPAWFEMHGQRYKLIVEKIDSE